MDDGYGTVSNIKQLRQSGSPSVAVLADETNNRKHSVVASII